MYFYIITYIYAKFKWFWAKNAVIIEQIKLHYIYVCGTILFMKITVTEPENGLEIKEYLRRSAGFSYTLVKQLKRSETGIILNGKRATVREVLHTGDELILDCETELTPESSVIPCKGSAEIVYEDDATVLFRKPSGVPTHPSRGHLTDTLANAAAYIYGQRGVPFIFRAVTRLDSDVSGIVLCAKTKLSAGRLSDDVANGRIGKRYLALCDGAPAKKGESGVIEGYIRRTGNSIITREITEEPEGGAFARTEYTVLAENGKRSLLSVAPITGRTHQIRVSLASIGAPIAGDGFYGNEHSECRCMLHAYELAFKHPISGEELCVRAPLFDDMKTAIQKEFGDIADE